MRRGETHTRARGNTTSQTAALGDRDTPDLRKGFYTPIDEEEQQEGKLHHITIIVPSLSLS